MDELGYTAHIFAWSHYTSHLSCGVRKSCLPLLCRLMGWFVNWNTDKVRCQGQILTVHFAKFAAFI
jgi:hypothetical protein